MTEASLQAVIREGLNRYSGSHRLSPHQWQVCHHILDCRTEALGGLGLDCDHCGQTLPHYYACRDRHCPRCQRRASQAWCERQQAAVLPVTYHHLVFTLPHALNPWVQLHPEVIYALLFETVWATLYTFGADPKRLGGQLGMTAVLHTWGQTLSQHVHLHCLIPGGAFSPQGRWHPAKSTYLFPVRALSRHIRGGFVSRLHMRCHRIALTDARILSLDDDQVQLDYKDYRNDNRHKIMTLAERGTPRRFLLHVLPKGFMRIRHFGFLSNRCRAERIKEIRAALNVAQQPWEASTEAESPAPFDGYPCPLCRKVACGSSLTWRRNNMTEADH